MNYCKRWFKKDVQKTDEQVETQQEPEEDHLEATSELIETMMMDPEPKFRESEFLEFLKKVRSGEYEIKNNEIIVHPEKANAQQFPETVAFDEGFTEFKTEAENFLKKMENTQDYEKQINEELTIQEEKERPNFERYFLNSENINKVEEQVKSDFNSAEMGFVQSDTKIEENKESNKIEELWNKLYQNYDENDPQLSDKLQQIWKESVKNYEDMNDPEALNDHWQKANGLQDLQYLDFNDNYQFEQTNPYNAHPQPITMLKEKLMSGDSLQTSLVLEAHIQKNPTDFRAWRSLGILFQDMDQDQKSVACFLNSLKHNPNDKNTFLQLGVSCINIFDEIHSMSFLEKWLLNNPIYNGLLETAGANIPLISDDSLAKQDWEISQIEEINKQMIDKFERVRSLSKIPDPELSLTLGVLNFTLQNYEQALFYFKQATEADPTNYSYLNKLGATYAYLKKPEESVQYYHKALDLKPNYVRGWTNLAINYNSQVR